MNHRICRVRRFEMVGPYVIRVEFDDRTVQTIDFEPVLAGELFRPLRDPALFQQVRLDPEAHTLVWPNGTDLDPATLHDWPEHVQAFVSRARVWSAATHGPSEEPRAVRNRRLHEARWHQARRWRQYPSVQPSLAALRPAP